MVVVDHSIWKKRADKIKLNTHLTVQEVYTAVCVWCSLWWCPFFRRWTPSRRKRIRPSYFHCPSIYWQTSWITATTVTVTGRPVLQPAARRWQRPSLNKVQAEPTAARVPPAHRADRTTGRPAGQPTRNHYYPTHPPVSQPARPIALPHTNDAAIKKRSRRT